MFMYRLRTLSAIITTLIALSMLVASPAAAIQRDSDDNPLQIENTEWAYGRSYAPDESARSATSASQSPDGYAVIATKLIDEDIIADSFPEFADHYASALGVTESEDAEQVEIERLGDEAVGYSFIKDGIPVTVAVVLEDDLLVVVAATNSTDLEDSTSVVEYMLDQEMSDDPAELNEDGTSTGGVFDIMPPAGHDVVHGMETGEDGSLTPESTK